LIFEHKKNGPVLGGHPGQGQNQISGQVILKVLI
jgi:hypothetical protein